MTSKEPGRLTVALLPPGLQIKAWPGAVKLHKFLAQNIEKPVDLWLTDNRSVLYSVQTKDGRCRLRLHHMFTKATGDTLLALTMLAGPLTEPRLAKWARKEMRAFARLHTDEIRLKKPGRRIRLKTMGLAHDLDVLMKEVVEEHMATDPAVSITWGRWGRPHRPQTKIRLGSYDPRRTLVRIHPVLDQFDVPAWVVKCVIFHELLHHTVPSKLSKGRFIHHGADFKALEAAHPDTVRFNVWLRTQLPALISGQKVAPEGKND